MTTIISLGGSIIIPDEIDTSFLKKFRDLLMSKEEKFAIYCGGGSIARKYQEAFKDIRGKDNEAMDWIGISATHLNAFLIKSIFHEQAEDTIIEDPTKPIKFNKKFLIAGGWKPGWSTDYDSILLAKNIGADTVINLTNVDYVYNKDPRKFKDAKRFEKISWQEFSDIIGDKWKPGLNAPFDPIAAKEAKKSNIKVIILGTDINNLENYLNNKKFKGTIIQ